MFWCAHVIVIYTRAAITIIIIWLNFSCIYLLLCCFFEQKFIHNFDIGTYKKEREIIDRTSKKLDGRSNSLNTHYKWRFNLHEMQKQKNSLQAIKNNEVFRWRWSQAFSMQYGSKRMPPNILFIYGFLYLFVSNLGFLVLSNSDKCVE